MELCSHVLSVIFQVYSRITIECWLVVVAVVFAGWHERRGGGGEHMGGFTGTLADSVTVSTVSQAPVILHQPTVLRIICQQWFSWGEIPAFSLGRDLSFYKSPTTWWMQNVVSHLSRHKPYRITQTAYLSCP